VLKEWLNPSLSRKEMKKDRSMEHQTEGKDIVRKI
jgi:hypothetical protein